MENQDSNNKNVSLSLIAEYGASDSESDTEVNKTVNDESVPELSEMVLKNNIINACAHGPLPARPENCDDDDDDDDDGTAVRHMIIDPQNVNGYGVAVYREDMSDTTASSSSDTDSDVDSIKDVEEVLSSGDEGTGASKAKPEAPKVNGEMGIEDLPPIEDLAISLPAEETLKIGVIYSIVEQLVIVKAIPGTPAVDLDSVLFLDHGAKTLGKVFDVFGPVTEPHYAVRFNSPQHAAVRGACVGACVYIAPETRHTSYVFLPDLMKMKGTDASWKNDIEPPASQVDYSDDEDERRAKREAKNRHNETEDGENSKNPRKVPQRSQRPSESSSRFGSGPSRGRNPFAAGSRRNPNTTQRYARPWNVEADVRTPPHHPNELPFGAPPHFPYMYGPFNPNSPPPFMYPNYPRMSAPMPHMGVIRANAPIFGSNLCNMAAAQPQWVNTDPPPPPPGT